MAPSTRQILLEEVSRHKTSNDAWIIIENFVYDITEFLPLHPAGDSIILPLLGQDATEEFNDVGHSKEARRLLIPLKLGVLKKDHKETSNEHIQHHDNEKISVPNLRQRSKETTALGQEPEEMAESGDYLVKSKYIDLKKPLLRQVYNLKLEEYVQFSQEKIYTLQSLRMFKSNLLEFLSRTQWFVVPLIWLPVSFLLICYGIMSNCELLFIAMFWLLGVFLWTFIEYLFHRFIFHFAEELLPNHGVAFVMHFALHAIHHVFPMDRLRLVMPPALFCVLASPVFIFSKSILCLPSPVLYSIWAGGICGYVAYDMIHYTTHHFSVERIPYLQAMKRYHMKHHHKNSTLGFGVSTKLWDFVFGTLLE